MLGLLKTGSPVLASPATRPGRKLAWTQEAIWHGKTFTLLKSKKSFRDVSVSPLPQDGFWVGVNTSIPNQLLQKAFHDGCLPFANGYTKCEMERKRGNSRIDALISGDGKKPIWVECKNVTLVEDNVALFPDAVSSRASKHLDELIKLVASNQRAALFCLVQRPDAKCFGPADIIDSNFAKHFWQAVHNGVEVWPFTADVSPTGVTLGSLLPLVKC